MIALPTEGVDVIKGDCREVMAGFAADSFDSIISDPPYGTGFMGKKWDTPGALVEREADRSQVWDNVGGNHNPTDGIDQARTRCAEGRRFGEWCGTWLPHAMRVLKPGGYMLAMGGSRTYHRLACAIEDAGFEVRDCLMWMYGTGFPKGHGCLKPAWEPILLARKPGKRVLPLGIDACRVGASGGTYKTHVHERNTPSNSLRGGLNGSLNGGRVAALDAGRWPANVVHDGSDEVMEAFAAFGVKTSGKASADGHHRNQPTREEGIYGGGKGLFLEEGPAGHLYGDSGSAARFFYTAKASKAERGAGNTHPTVKPLSLMRWMVRLVTPPGGLILDPFAGSGSTLLAALQENMRAVGIEQDAGHCAIIHSRLQTASGTAPGSLLAG